MAGDVGSVAFGVDAVDTTVLLIEDDEAIRTSVRLLLAANGFTVLEAPSGEDGLALVSQADVALVDLRLPGIDGFEVIAAIRTAEQLPIVILTAQSEREDVVRGLEAGADDYITKPFDGRELVARIRSLLRRTVKAESTSVGRFTVTPSRAEITRDGVPLVLTRTEYEMLVKLLHSPGVVHSRDQLLRDVWGYQYAGDGRVVDNLVYRLRTKIEDDPAEPKHLQTVRGFGYSFSP